MSNKTKTEEKKKAEAIEEKKKAENAMKEVEQQRAKEREACLKEIDATLNKYNCILSSRVIVGERGNIPQVFLIDKPNE